MKKVENTENMATKEEKKAARKQKFEEAKPILKWVAIVGTAVAGAAVAIHMINKDDSEGSGILDAMDTLADTGILDVVADA